MPSINLSIPSFQAVVQIVAYFLVASLIAAFSGRLTRRLLAFNRLAPSKRRLSPERQRTLQLLVGDGITVLAFAIAFLASLALFVPAETVVWIVGLFGTAFGLAARPLVSDFLAGIGFIFNETFDMGEKIEFIVQMSSIQGVVEGITLTASQVRAPTGELYTVPNGEIRVVRNFSRGKFSMVTIPLAVHAEDLNRAVEALKMLGDDIYRHTDWLIEPWQVLSPSGLTADRVDLNLLAKAAFGKAVEIKLEITNRIYDCFKQENIPIL